MDNIKLPSCSWKHIKRYMAFTDGEGEDVQGMPKIQLLIEGKVGDLLGDRSASFPSAQITPLIMPVLWAEWEYMCVCVCSVSTH